ncbi:hypothetical protein [Novosphingobium sp. CCH12-A3]|uniref:hypothetical protein n=1 Tax=Novosphingobium sp. CCH12-A3 TaxID=1768752 RepID=UPI0007830351|nr:hypothetical protein [Novosphingobium sp. CCH12-A3]
MSARATPFADLRTSLDRLEQTLPGAGELEGTSPGYICVRLLPILASLAEVVKASRAALEPDLREEMHRANAADLYRANAPAGEA